MNDEARQLVALLGLSPLPGEGGFFAPSWTSAARGAGGRPLASAILFLITDTDFSALHRLDIEEVWGFHAGDPSELVILGPSRDVGRSVVLGPDPLSGQAPQATVPAGSWQGARLLPGGRGWALLGCVVSPAWDGSGFELGSRDRLLEEFPSQAGRVRSLTR
jgi:predicted cupin superfamily sugar epimerase